MREKLDSHDLKEHEEQASRLSMYVERKASQVTGVQTLDGQPVRGIRKDPVKFIYDPKTLEHKWEPTTASENHQP